MLTSPPCPTKLYVLWACPSFSQVLDPSSKPAIEHDIVNTWSQAKTKSLTLGTVNK